MCFKSVREKVFQIRKYIVFNPTRRGESEDYFPLKFQAEYNSRFRSIRGPVSRSLLLSCEILRQDTKLLLKTFRKIRGRIESYQVTDLVHLIIPLHEILRSPSKPNLFDKIVGCHTEKGLHLDIQDRTAHVDHLCQIFDGELGVGQIALDNLIQPVQKNLVGSGLGYRVMGIRGRLLKTSQSMCRFSSRLLI